jgi:8-oxo-dGTP pyrophosphatase MutT (NUDIX family)
MSPARPDLVECFVFRIPGESDEPQILLIRRAPGRIFAGLWQPVTGGIVADETVPAAALREVAEEVGFAGDDVVGFYDLDQTTHFYDEGTDAIVAGAIFALRVSPEAVARLSEEHDDHRWVGPAEAVRIAVWPSYRESIGRIVDHLVDPERARWFALDGEGRRLAR